MVNMTRENVIAVGVLALLLLMCILMVGFSLEARFDASRALAERREMLTRLETQARSRAGSGGRSIAGVAPPAALLTAPTQGLAGAELLGYVSRLSIGQQAVLISSGVDSTREALPNVIRIQASMDMRLRALQSILFQLETGTPYVFVESLTVVPAGAGGQGVLQDPTLRVTLVLSALWRREAA